MDALRHRMRSLPELAELADAQKRRTTIDGSVRDLRVQVSDLTEDQRKAEADVEQVRARRDRDQGMVDTGAVKDPKALERMLGELESLQRRIGTLEDEELEVMEHLEASQIELDRRTSELAGLDEEIARLQQSRDARTAELQAELTSVEDERKTAVEGLPEDLLKLYERLREQKGGVGAAALRARECQGCRLSLNASDLGAIAKAPADEVIRCEECNRILVRTPESGL